MVKIMLILASCLVLMILCIMWVQFKVSALHVVPSTLQWESVSLPSTPNYFLVCPQSICERRADQESPIFPVSVTTLKLAWQRLIKQQPRLSLLYIDQQAEQYWYVQHSRLFRFPDIITVEFIKKNANESSIILYSRAEYGYQDFGVNKKRCQAWLQELRRICVSERSPE